MRDVGQLGHDIPHFFVYMRFSPAGFEKTVGTSVFSVLTFVFSLPAFRGTAAG